MSKKDKRKLNGKALRRALSRMDAPAGPPIYGLSAPELPPGVRPKNSIAMDHSPLGNFGADCFFGTGFAGYPRLAELAQIAEYRSVTETTANEMTRQWIEIKSVGEEDNSETIKAVEECYERLNVRDIFRKAIETDGFFGRGQIIVHIKGHDGHKLANPLLLTEKTIAKGCLKGLTSIEPMWSTPAVYNATDPTASDFYKPKSWYVMGQEIHASRLFTLIARPVPDMLKAAYNFGGVSMSQLMMPYVERWLRTVDSVSDLLHSFSLSGIKTDMSAVLAGGCDDMSVQLRAEMYNRLRDNRGLMLLDKDMEEFFQFNTPLSGLDTLLAQAQEQMAAPSHTPLVKLLGITPSGLNASSEGEIAVYYDYIRAMQENILRDPLDKLLKLVQLHLFGKVNDAITFDFRPLAQMDENDLAAIRKSDSDRDVAYIQAGVVSAEEVRNRLASEPDSGYSGIDVEDVPEMPDDGFSGSLNGEAEDDPDPKPEPAQDAEWDESKHPRAENGQFGEGGNRQPESENTAAQQAAVSVSGSELGSFAETKDLRKAAMQYARDKFVGKSYTNKDSGHEIQVTWQGIKHAANGANSTELKVMAKLDQLLEQSSYVGVFDDRKSRADIIAAHKYQVPVAIDGEQLNIGIVVREMKDGHKHYDHFILKSHKE